LSNNAGMHTHTHTRTCVHTHIRTHAHISTRTNAQERGNETPLLSSFQKSSKGLLPKSTLGLRNSNNGSLSKSLKNPTSSLKPKQSQALSLWGGISCVSGLPRTSTYAHTYTCMQTQQTHTRPHTYTTTTTHDHTQPHTYTHTQHTPHTHTQTRHLLFTHNCRMLRQCHHSCVLVCMIASIRATHPWRMGVTMVVEMRSSL
jgi:hypothetical protein